MSTQSDILAASGDAGAPLTQKHESLFRDAMRRLVRNKAAVVGGIIVISLLTMSILAPVLAPASFETQVRPDANKVPQWVVTLFPSMAPYAKFSANYPLGADDLGRDLLSRIMYGSRISLAVAIIAPLISMTVGATFGTISGYFGGRVDNIMMRIVDVLYAFPSILFIILMMAVFRSTLSSAAEPGTLTYFMNRIDAAMGGLFFIFVGIGLTAWETMARLARGQVLSVREKEYVEAARAMGAGDRRIMSRHILPNIIGPLIVAETMAIPVYIGVEAFLSFIGLGVNPPTPSWGAMISEGSRAVRTYPNQAIFPATALMITMLAFNFLGDGLRDAFDPRLRGRQ